MPGCRTVTPSPRHGRAFGRTGAIRLGALLLASAVLGALPASAESGSGPTALVGLFLPGRHPVQATVPIGPDGSIRVRFGSVERTAGVAPAAGLSDKTSSSPTATKGSIEALIESKGDGETIRVDAALRETLILDGRRPENAPENGTSEVFAWSFAQTGRMTRIRGSRRYEHVSNDAVLVIAVSDEGAPPSEP